eukprot:CAMPEP_0173408420 /NCGR_PEP_ID=MMETSP1356-20130122/69704_1 /TAXON_ID=77927 ORGANISM="Hemiselmis virescens, Strain PCC157" /NCGR_SAMPLE_ID=MMETSP1356 /ASSEMBLY_ACC=CAM_ASM_000847 /LENGTH=71 /DNA_ID=CAMNT_0014369735 /DNA_START=26 /DNA_END=241 /DNA_ORIENTATION=+
MQHSGVILAVQSSLLRRSSTGAALPVREGTIVVHSSTSLSSTPCNSSMYAVSLAKRTSFASVPSTWYGSLF